MPAPGAGRPTRRVPRRVGRAVSRPGGSPALAPRRPAARGRTRGPTRKQDRPPAPSGAAGTREQSQLASDEVQGRDPLVTLAQPDVRDSAAEIHVQLVGDVALRAVCIRRAGDVVLHGRASLGLVGVEQPILGPAAQHPGELPPKVVAVADRCVHPGCAARGDPMRRVAGEQYRPLAEALGHPGEVAERPDALDQRFRAPEPPKPRRSAVPSPPCRTRPGRVRRGRASRRRPSDPCGSRRRTRHAGRGGSRGRSHSGDLRPRPRAERGRSPRSRRQRGRGHASRSRGSDGCGCGRRPRRRDTGQAPAAPPRSAASRMVARTPSAVISKSTSSVPNRTSPVPAARRCRSTIGSSSSCPMTAGALGLTAALCSSEGKLAGISKPPGSASVSAIHPRGSASTALARTSSSNPQARRSSIDQVLAAFARGRGESPERRSTRRLSIPYRARVVAVMRPAGPAPTIRTGSSWTSCFGMRVSRFRFDRTPYLSEYMTSDEIS